MNKREATRALKHLTYSGWQNGQFIRWSRGDYSILVTDQHHTQIVLHTQGACVTS